MGFLDYAGSISLQEDRSTVSMRTNSILEQPTFTKEGDRYKIILPEPTFLEDKSITFLGYRFHRENAREKACRLFRACVYHLTGHTLIPKGYNAINQKESPLEENFANSLVADIYVNSYLSNFHPDKLLDLAFANSYSFVNLRPVERIFNISTRIMTALLTIVNLGNFKGILKLEERRLIEKEASKLFSLREKIIKSLKNEENNITTILDKAKSSLIDILLSNGPIVETPSFQHTENIGSCSIFSKLRVPYEFEIERSFRESLSALGSKIPPGESFELYKSKEKNVESSQVFESQLNQNAREDKVLSKIKKHTESSKFKSVGFPFEDYSGYLKSRNLLRGGSRRLLDSLRVAKDALDEDPRKEMGQLDLTEVIQKIASQSPRTDVFMQNEYLSTSFAWSILFDVSGSMNVRSSIGRAFAISVAEATSNLLMDPGSWSFYAFSDRFFILKDVTEAYSRRVRARIGGLEFDGSTYLPDAIEIAGNVLARRFDEQRFLIILSDGVPYGYPEIEAKLEEILISLEKKGILIIGIGLESEKIAEFFKTSCVVYNQKDLIKRFAKIFVKSSATALER